MNKRSNTPTKSLKLLKKSPEAEECNKWDEQWARRLMKERKLYERQ